METKLTAEEKIVIRSLLIEHVWEYEKVLSTYSSGNQLHSTAKEDIRARITDLKSLADKIDSL